MSENSSMIRNVFAAVGVIFVTVKAVDVFRTHVQAPMEKRLADIFTDEQEQAAEARTAVVREWNAAIDTVIEGVDAATATAALAAGATPAQAAAAADAATELLKTQYRT